MHVDDSLNCTIEILDSLTERAQGRQGKLIIWSIERPRTFECCDVIVPKDLPGFDDLPIRIETVVAATILRFHCEDRQRQVADSFTKIRLRGSSTVKPSSIEVPVLRNQAVILTNIDRKASEARPPVLPGRFHKLSVARNDNDLSQCYQDRVVTPIANSLDCDFAVIHMMM